MRKRRAIDIQVRDTSEGRVVISRYADGQERRATVVPNQKPRRKPRKPFATLKAAREKPSEAQD
jgi:hypothetical protein